MNKSINFIFTHQFNNYFLPNGLNNMLVENYIEQANLHEMSLDAYIKSGHGDPTGINALSKKHNKKFYLHYTRDLYQNILNNLNKINDFKYEFEYQIASTNYMYIFRAPNIAFTFVLLY